jgi:hypothetical protein
MTDSLDKRWPRKGDRIFVSGRDAWPANRVGEREYRIAKGYKLAGDILAQNLLGDTSDYDNLLYPILFCYEGDHREARTLDWRRPGQEGP